MPTKISIVPNQRNQKHLEITVWGRKLRPN